MYFQKKKKYLAIFLFFLFSSGKVQAMELRPDQRVRAAACGHIFENRFNCVQLFALRPENATADTEEQCRKTFPQLTGASSTVSSEVLKSYQAIFFMPQKSCEEVAKMDPSTLTPLPGLNLDELIRAAEDREKQQAEKDNAKAEAEKNLLRDVNVTGLNKIGANTTLESFVGRLIKAAMGILGTIALGILVYAGVLWMTAAGNSDRERKALDMMFWGALGVIVILSSYAIVQFIVQNTFTP